MDKLHEIIEKLEDCMYTQICGGIENVDTDEMYKVADIHKDLVESEYHLTITKAMKENADDYGDTWDENGKKGYNSHKSTGKIMKGYEEPMMYDERMNDYKNGRMHYTEPVHSSESKYDSTRRMYTESKMMNPADKAEHLTKINKHIDTFKSDLMELKDNMSNEERQTVRTKLTNMASEI